MAVEAERSAEAREETVELERAVLVAEGPRSVRVLVGLSAWAHGVVQMLLEWPQA